MSMSKPSRPLHGRAYKMVRLVVWVLCVCLLLLLSGAVYLNLYGVPDPVLRRIEEKIGASGIPVEIESIHLSLHGWRAAHIRCYSTHPDQLEPVVQIRELYLRRHDILKGENAPSRGYDISANDLLLSPLCDAAGFAEDEALRRIERARVSLGLASDRLLVRDGQLVWHDVVCNVNGTVQLDAEREQKGSRATDILSVSLDAQLYQQLSAILDALELSEAFVVDVDFRVDAARPASSRLELAAHTGAFRFRDVLFSRFDSAGAFTYPQVQVDHATVHRDNERLDIGGEYDLESNEALIRVTNSMASAQLLKLVPPGVPDLLAQCGIQTDSFPVFQVQLGPAEPLHLLEKLSGSFAVRHLSIQELEIDALSGSLSRTGGRVDFSRLQGEVLGQEHRSSDAGSCLVGGAVSGSAFWDAASHEFGVAASGEMDPNLLLKPVSVSAIATNVISRFRFDDQPPRLQAELGACYDDWRSFYIRIQGSVSNMRLHEVPFSALNAAVDYRAGVLSIDRFAARQNVDFVKGSAALDFRNGLAHFDATGHVNPRTLEDVIYPRYGIFRKFVKVNGPARLSGQGTVDWRTMQATSFSAEVEADGVELPVAALKRFSARITGTGPEVRVEEAAFKLNGGQGSGMLSVLLDPANRGVPYGIDLTLRNVDFNKFLTYLYPDKAHTATGDLSGRLKAQADFSRPFFEVANGEGRVNLRHGQLTDLPLFSGFSKIIRIVLPSFKVFSIHTLEGDFLLKTGVVSSENAYFGGELLSAKGRGSYSLSRGFDAYVQAQVLSDNNLSRLFRFFTDPLLKLFELKLEGSFENPEWKLNTFAPSAKKRDREE